MPPPQKKNLILHFKTITPMYFLYIDPGAGSLVFQALLSAGLTIVIFYKRIFSYVKYMAKKNSDNKEKDQPN